MANLKNTTIDDTGNFTLSSGTTAQRPALPQAGAIRYNSTTNRVEEFKNSSWQNLAPPSSPSINVPFTMLGGIVRDVTIGGILYRIHHFINTGSSTVSVTGEGVYDCLVVGGGGGGADLNDAGGGGAGGVVYRPNVRVSAGNLTVTVGAGGGRGASGSSSSISGVATAGGGEAAPSNVSAGTAAARGGNSGSPQTLAGGAGGGSVTDGGGGAGAGDAGFAATASSGRGGPGLFFGNEFTNIYGDAGWFASGGSGGGEGTAQLRQPGGGGIGGDGTSQADRDAIPNTGGGGGGNNDAGNNALRNAGPGGSGTVLIRYRVY